MPFHLFTDDLVQGLLDRLHEPGIRRLEELLLRGSQQSSRNGEIYSDFQEVDFAPDTGVAHMRLHRRLSDGFAAVPEIRFTDGTALDRVGLHLRGAVLPETVLATLPGRRVGEIAQGAILANRTVKGARTFRGHTLITLATEEAILAVPEGMGPIAADRLDAAVAPALGRACDPLAAAFLRALPIERRKQVIIEVENIEDGLVDTGLSWEDVTGGNAPSGMSGKVLVDENWGRIRLQRAKGKSGVMANVWLNTQADKPGTIIEKGVIQPITDFGSRAKLSEVVGFQLPGDQTVKQGSLYGVIRYPLKPTMTLADALPERSGT